MGPKRRVVEETVLKTDDISDLVSGQGVYVGASAVFVVLLLTHKS